MLCSKENAHDDSIWGCVWGQIKRKKENINGEKEDLESHEDEQVDVVDYIVTGAVDDCVKLWSFEDKKLQLNHKLESHSLGVVSVTINSDGTSECYALYPTSSLKVLDIFVIEGNEDVLCSSVMYQYIRKIFYC